MKKTFLRACTSLSLIVLVALAVRVTSIGLKLSALGFPHEYGAEAHRVAKAIASGKGFSSAGSLMQGGPTAVLPPVYPYLLAGIYHLFGIGSSASFAVATGLNCLFSALTCIPVFFIGKRIGGLAVASAGGWLWAVFPTPLTIIWNWVWDVSLFTLLVACIVWMAIALRDSDCLWHYVAFGALCALTLMVNPSIVSALPFLIAWSIYKVNQPTRRWLNRGAVVLTLIFVGCLPWTIRNYVQFHKFIPFRSEFGLELWLGNHDSETALTNGFYTQELERQDNIRGAEIGEIAQMREKEEIALQYMESHPKTTFWRIWSRVKATWVVPIIFDEGHDSGQTIQFAFNDMLVVFGLVGVLALYRQRHRLLFPLLIVPLVFPVVYYITHTSWRYRHPADPNLVILASFGLAVTAQPLVRRMRTHSVTSKREAALDGPIRFP